MKAFRARANRAEILARARALASEDHVFMMALVDELEEAWRMEDLAWGEALSTNDAWLRQRETCKRMWTAIRWACGYEVEGKPDFGEIMQTELNDAVQQARKVRPYWWRAHLQQLAGMLLGSGPEGIGPQ